VRFDVPLAADLPSSRLQAEYALIRVEPTGDDGTTVGNGRFRFSVQGVPVNVTAQLDHDHVGAGGAIALTLTLDGSQLTTPLLLFAQVSYPPFDERREFELGPAGTQVRFEVPIERPGAELGYGIYFPSGRALYLDALTIHPAGGPVEITASQREYRPGEQVSSPSPATSRGLRSVLVRARRLALGLEWRHVPGARRSATGALPDPLDVLRQRTGRGRHQR
jgi:hypothetical protein